MVRRPTQLPAVRRRSAALVADHGPLLEALARAERGDLAQRAAHDLVCHLQRHLRQVAALRTLLPDETGLVQSDQELARAFDLAVALSVSDAARPAWWEVLHELAALLREHCRREERCLDESGHVPAPIVAPPVPTRRLVAVS